MMLCSERLQAPSTKSPHTEWSLTAEEEADEREKKRKRRVVFIVDPFLLLDCV